MQLPESWLREFCNPSIPVETLVDTLTMAGLEVEELRSVAPPFEKVVVGQIKTLEPHPKSDRLRICAVDVGQGAMLSIVCGAPNAAIGMKVPCAMLGAQLPPSEPGGACFEIKPIKLLGVESLGMLCSAKELQISQEGSGLLQLPQDAPIGVNVREFLNLDDALITIKLTPNLAHCLSVYGVARELSALTQTPLLKPPAPITQVNSAEVLRVKVSAPDLCGRFSGRIVRGLSKQALTPAWMVERLERCGQRSVSPLVDISNYVMFEYGQPTHIFDLDKINGALEVRWAKEGESLKLLSGQTIVLDGDVGVISDDVAIESLAGIMGGEATAVGDDTESIYIEAAFWWPQAVAGRSRKYNFSSEASHRFERGVDPSQTVEMIERITQLVLEICGTPQTVCGPIDDQLINMPQTKRITLRVDRACRVIGMELSQSQMSQALKSLGLEVSEEPGLIHVTSPLFRFDLQIEEDLIEEVIRCIGYEHLPESAPIAPITAKLQAERFKGPFDVRHLMAGLGFQETINYSFVDEAWEREFAPGSNPIKLLNPIASSMNVMRTTLLPSLLQVVKYNVDRKMSSVRAFELGRVFLRDEKVDDSDQTVKGLAQPMRIAAVAYGLSQPLQWASKETMVDYFDLKADLLALMHPLQPQFKAAQHPAMHPGRCAQVELNGHIIGHLGELHPKLKQTWGLAQTPVMFELDLQAVCLKGVPHFAGVEKHQDVERDIAIVVKETVLHDELMTCIWACQHDGILKNACLFDVYRPKEESAQLAQDEKSLAIRLILNKSEGTLTEPEIEALVDQVVKALVTHLGARLRA
jgi:phenylalanyl-tRNA synthetase beta chain